MTYISASSLAGPSVRQPRCFLQIGDAKIPALSATVTLTGTGTIYDTSYQIDEVEFTMGWDKDFEVTVQAKGTKAGRAS